MPTLDSKDRDFLEIALARLSGLSSYDDLALAEKQASLADLGLNLRERELSDNYQSALKAREQAQPRLGILDAIGGIITSGPRVRGGIKEPIKYENWMTADERLKLDDAVNQAASERDRNFKAWYESMRLAKNAPIRLGNMTGKISEKIDERNDPNSVISLAAQKEASRLFPGKDFTGIPASILEKTLRIRPFEEKTEKPKDSADWQVKMDGFGRPIRFNRRTGEVTTFGNAMTGSKAGSSDLIEPMPGETRQQYGARVGIWKNEEQEESKIARQREKDLLTANAASQSGVSVAKEILDLRQMADDNSGIFGVGPLKGLATDMASKLGTAPNVLASQYLTTLERKLSAYGKEISGATIPVEEMERIKKQLPSIFDTEDATKAKLVSAIKELQAVSNRIRMEKGLDAIEFSTDIEREIYGYKPLKRKLIDGKIYKMSEKGVWELESGEVNRND
jgi:hypothetical protein